MNRPLPIIATPSAASRIAFMRAMKAANINWCGNSVTQDLLRHDPDTSYRYAYLSLSYRSLSFVFCEDERKGAAMLANDRYTLVNSPKHFIAYASQFSVKPPLRPKLQPGEFPF